MPVNGKTLGISSTQFNTYEDLYDKYGFTGMFIYTENQKASAEYAGFELDEMMANVTANSFGDFDYPNGLYGYYHLDEPLEREYPVNVNYVIDIADAIEMDNPNAKLLLSSWKKVGSSYSWGYNTILSNTSNTQIICDQYYDGSVWCGDDQRSYWSSYKSYYGSANVKTYWISLLIDGQQNDFGVLFDKANSLGINILWLFVGDAGDDWCGGGEELTSTKYYNNLKGFCSDAWKKGWLRYYERKYIYDYRCFLSNPCSNCQFPDDFILLEKIKTDEIREVYY